MAMETQQVPAYHLAAIVTYSSELQLYCTDREFLGAILAEVGKLVSKMKVSLLQGLEGDNTRAWLRPPDGGQWVLITDWLAMRFATSGWEPFAFDHSGET